MSLITFIYAVCAGIVQGVTEWLPISSTGHLILLGSLFSSAAPSLLTDEFREISDVVIQLFSALAVALLYFDRLNPLSRKKNKEEKSASRALWGKIIIASVPAAVSGFFLDDFLTENVFTPARAPTVVACALIVYGVVFVFMGRFEKRRRSYVTEAEAVGVKRALGIGLFQTLSLIPGTSRSGSTILGATALGVSRRAAAEFSFFLALPVMFGATIFKCAKFVSRGIILTYEQYLALAVSSAFAFFVSLVTVKFLISFVKNHSFAPFGVYRIALGAAILLSKVIS